jgi:hypothetical protein
LRRLAYPLRYRRKQCLNWMDDRQIPLMIVAVHVAVHRVAAARAVELDVLFRQRGAEASVDVRDGKRVHVSGQRIVAIPRQGTRHRIGVDRRGIMTP